MAGDSRAGHGLVAAEGAGEHEVGELGVEREQRPVQARAEHAACEHPLTAVVGTVALAHLEREERPCAVVTLRAQVVGLPPDEGGQVEAGVGPGDHRAGHLVVGVHGDGRQPEALLRRARGVDPGAAHRVETRVDGEQHGSPVADADGEVGVGDRVDERLHAAAAGAPEEVDVGVDERLGPVDRDGLDRDATGGSAPSQGAGIRLIGCGDGGEREQRRDGDGLARAQWVPPRNCLEMRRKAG